MSPDAAWAETDELRVAERSNPQIKSYVRPEEAAEKGAKAVLSRDDIRRHLTSEMVFDGDRLPGFSFSGRPQVCWARSRPPASGHAKVSPSGARTTIVPSTTSSHSSSYA